MKKIITTLLLTAFITPQISFAANDVTVTCSPPSPLVMTQVFCRASGISNMEKLLIEWDIEDVKQLSGYGYRNFDFRTKATKYVYEVGVTVYTADGSKHYGNASVTTRGIGDKAENHRFSLLPTKAGDKIRVEASPPYPKSFERTTLTVEGNIGKSGFEDEYRLLLSRATSIEWRLDDINKLIPDGIGATYSFRVGAGTEPIPVKVIAKGIDFDGVPYELTLTTQLKPTPNGFIPEYDNASRAFLCSARAMDSFLQNTDRLSDEIDRFGEQMNEMTAQLLDDVDYLTSFYANFEADIMHDIGLLGEGPKLASMCPTPWLGCARAGVQAASAYIKLSVSIYTGTNGKARIARIVTEVQKRIENITTFADRIDRIIEQKKQVLEGMQKQMDNRVANCNRAFKKVNNPLKK